MLVRGGMGKEGLDFRRTHFGGMAFAMKEDEATHPLEVRLLGAVGVVASAQSLAHALEKVWFARLWRGNPGFCRKRD